MAPFTCPPHPRRRGGAGRRRARRPGGGGSRAWPAVRGAEISPALPHLWSLSVVLRYPESSTLSFPEVLSVLGTSCPLPAQERRGEGPEPGEGEEVEDKEKPSAAVKGGAEAPSGYSHSSGIWMSRQGLHRRRGHKYRSATAIFPAAPAARRGKSRPGSAQAPARGKGAGGRLGEGAGGGDTARGEEGRER